MDRLSSSVLMSSSSNDMKTLYVEVIMYNNVTIIYFKKTRHSGHSRHYALGDIYTGTGRIVGYLGGGSINYGKDRSGVFSVVVLENG